MFGDPWGKKLCFANLHCLLCYSQSCAPLGYETCHRQLSFNANRPLRVRFPRVGPAAIIAFCFVLSTLYELSVQRKTKEHTEVCSLFGDPWGKKLCFANLHCLLCYSQSCAPLGYETCHRQLSFNANRPLRVRFPQQSIVYKTKSTPYGVLLFW